MRVFVAALVLSACRHEPARTEPTSLATVRVIDADTKQPIPAHLWIHGGASSEERDLARGAFEERLRVGHYRVSARHGPEWTIAGADFDLGEDSRAITLELRHVIVPETFVACDLRVQRGDANALVARAAAEGVRFSIAADGMERDLASAISRFDLGSRVTFVSEHDAPLPRTSESHSRTYVNIGGWRQGYAGGPLDVATTLKAAAAGQSFVTTGPFLELTVFAHRPGMAHANREVGTDFAVGEEEVALPGGTIARAPRIRAHLRVRAPGWMTLERVSIVAGERTLWTAPIHDGGFDGDVTFEVPANAPSILATANASAVDPDVGPVPWLPSASTSPIWIQ